VTSAELIVPQPATLEEKSRWRTVGAERLPHISATRLPPDGMRADTPVVVQASPPAAGIWYGAPLSVLTPLFRERSAHRGAGWPEIVSSARIQTFAESTGSTAAVTELSVPPPKSAAVSVVEGNDVVMFPTGPGPDAFRTLMVPFVR
jgi:hypothetical protein